MTEDAYDFAKGKPVSFHEGQSECMNGSSEIDSKYDELCEFEQIRKIGDTTRVLETELITEDCGDGLDNGGMINTG